MSFLLAIILLLDVWDQFLDAHNNQDMDAIMALEADDIKIWGPDGAVIEGKKLIKNFYHNGLPLQTQNGVLIFRSSKYHMEEQPGHGLLLVIP